MMKIGGLQKMTLIDYPGKVAASIFVVGCNFRCGFCHNPNLVEVKPNTCYLSEDEIFQFLQKRRGLLDGVCISGGEPLIYEELPEFIQRIKALGFLIKLDTNGLNYALLEKLMAEHLLDYIAMDIKASLENYAQVCGVKLDVNKIPKSINLIINSGLAHEFRSTVLPKYHNAQEIEKMAKMIQGAKHYFLQNFRNQHTLSSELAQARSFTQAELKELQKIAVPYVQDCQIRQ